MQSFLQGSGILCLYFIVAATTFFLLRKLTRFPDELFRKCLHYILQVSYILFFFCYDVWWQAAILGFLIIAIAYPAFQWCGRFPAFSSFVNERKQGEFKNSLVLAFVMLAICAAVCWGILGDRHLGLACMYAWGIGDGFAALIGKRFGRHKIRMRFADPHKSVEGSAAMLVTSFTAAFLVLYSHGHLSLVGAVVIALAGSATATLTELVTHNGLDTITCPLAAMSVMIPLMYVFGGFQ